LLAQALEKGIEFSRVQNFSGEDVLEFIRPFIVEDEIYGVFRIGIGFEGYYRQVRETKKQLFLLFIILFASGFVLFFLFTKFQSYVNLKELFSETLGAIDEGIILTNASGVITGINKQFCSITNYDEKFLLNNNYNSIFKKDVLELNRVLKEKIRIEKEKAVFNRIILCTSYPLIDEKNKLIGAIAILRDVTRIREFEKEREETERLQLLGNLVANFAHEIRNPLNGISIASQRLVREFPQDDKEYRELTQTIIKEIELLNKTLNDFLSLARPRIKERIQFNLSALIQNTLNLIREQAQKRQVILKEKLSQDIEISGNPDDFRRAILNILLNALDAVEDKTGRIVVELVRQRGDVVLKIADNGLGMDKEVIERIFTPYYPTKTGGTGLGLYIAQRILKEHQARLSVRSKKDKGTTFKIILQ